MNTGHRSKDRRRQNSHSLPRNIHGRHSDGEDISEPAMRGQYRQRKMREETERSSKSEERRRQPKNMRVRKRLRERKSSTTESSRKKKWTCLFITRVESEME